MHRLLGLVVVALVTLVAQPSWAEDFFDVEEWEDTERGWGWEGSVGGVAALEASMGEGFDTGSTGVRLTAGFRRRGRFESKNVFGNGSSAMAWCAPMMGCGPLFGMLLMPKSALLGNEWGVDATLEVTRFWVLDDTLSERSYRIAAGFRPVVRVLRDSRARTASYLGSLLPETRFAVIDGRLERFEIQFHLYPIALLVGNHVGFEIDVSPYLFVPLRGERVSGGATLNASAVVF